MTSFSSYDYVYIYTLKNWITKFRRVRVVFKDELRSGRPIPDNVCKKILPTFWIGLLLWMKLGSITLSQRLMSNPNS